MFKLKVLLTLYCSLSDQLSDCPARYVNEGVYNDIDCTAPINAWAQAVPYCLIAFSEVFASITGLEYAISKVSLPKEDTRL